MNVNFNSQLFLINQKGGTIMSLKRKRNIKLVAIFGLTAVLLITTGWSVMASVESEPVFVPSGPYIYASGQRYAEIIIPNDPAGNTITIIGPYLVVDPTLGRMFPEADNRLECVGRGVRTGPYTWHNSYIQYASKGQEIQFILLFSADVTFSEDGETMDMYYTAEIFLPEQDADNDGFPDEGEVPFFAGSGGHTLKRVPMRPLYVPPEE
jgi:hypothetical protein